MPWWCGNPVDRFYKKIRKSRGCWIWTGGEKGGGYGRFKVGGRDMFAHRYSYELHCGPFDESLVVMHSCDNPPCVNPAHLSLGTPLTNNRDAIAKGRRRFRAFHSNAKLTEKQVKAIRDEYSSEQVRQVDLAAKYGVCKSLIHAIVCNKVWREPNVKTPRRNRWSWEDRRRVFVGGK